MQKWRNALLKQDVMFYNGPDVLQEILANKTDRWFTLNDIFAKPFTLKTEVDISR
jgi:hypothetical protein